MVVAAIPAIAQTTLSGRIVDAGSGTPLTGAVITSSRSGDAAISSNDGTFRMKSIEGGQELTVSYLGYHNKTVSVAAGAVDLGEIAMEADAISVADVVVVAGIVTNDRQTPVAVSNITRSQIDMKLSNQEFPEILKSTPSVYATKTSGGYGDSQIRIRGFNNNNVGVLINGVPVNDMENGRVYWSNWSGLSEVTSFMQVQRGLGASKLGISSVGGTINIVTKSTDAERGGSVYYGIGSDGLQKLNVSVSTGLLDNGWAFSMAGGRQSADGYIRGTNYEAWNYFVNLSKLFAGGRHRLSLTAFGAPQWHNQRYNRHLIEDYVTNPEGRRMNLNYGYLNGKVLSTNYNTYHKPQISLVHTWNIDSKSMLSTSVYASIARGGGRTAMGSNSSWMRLGSDGKIVEGTSKRTSDGLINWNYIFEQNKNNVNGSSVAFAMMNNSHDWYGVLSSYNNQITPEIKITAGFDGRYYKGYHSETVENLLGGRYIIDNRIDYRPANTQLHEGDIENYDEIGEVSRAGVFAQAEYLKNDFSAFLSGSVSGHFIRWSNLGQEPEAGHGRVSDWLGFMPWSIKGGASYKLWRNHSVFANAGYFTIAPQRSNAFIGYSTTPNRDATMEQVTTVEAGYTFANNMFNVTFNGYYTLWLDRGMAPVRVAATDVSEEVVYNVEGVNARHMGLELEATYRPSTRFSLKAMGSVGDWIWRDDVHYTAYNSSQNVAGSFEAYIGGIHVGDSAQITAALGVEWEPLKGLRLGADYNWFGKNFASFYPDSRTKPTDKVEAWRLPDYATVDVQLSYEFRIGDKVRGTFYGNVNNLLDTWYISDANDTATTHDAATALVWYGFGRTWTAGLKFNF